MPRLLSVPLRLRWLDRAGLMALVLHPEPPQADGRPLFRGPRSMSPHGLFQRSYQNCHSERTEWPWYIRILQRRGSLQGRPRRPPADESSQWTGTRRMCRDLLARMGVAVRSGRMPLPRYVFVHRKAILTAGAGADLRWTAERPPARRGDQKRLFREPLSAFAVTAAARGDGYAELAKVMIACGGASASVPTPGEFAKMGCWANSKVLGRCASCLMAK